MILLIFSLTPFAISFQEIQSEYIFKHTHFSFHLCFIIEVPVIAAIPYSVQWIYVTPIKIELLTKAYLREQKKELAGTQKLFFLTYRGMLQPLTHKY